MPADLGGFVIGLIGALTTIASVIVLIVKSRGENRTAESNAKVALDARIDARVSTQLNEAWGEIKQLKSDFKELQTRQVRRDGAITRILRAIANQWPNSDGPNLDPSDIVEIEETIPAQWIRKPKPPIANIAK